MAADENTEEGSWIVRSIELLDTNEEKMKNLKKFILLMFKVVDGWKKFKCRRNVNWKNYADE